MGLIHEKLAACVAEIGAVGKNQRCQAGASFAFRGIDDALEAAHGVFAAHGIIMLPGVESADYSEVKTAKGGTQIYARLRVRYAFTASDGSAAECVTMGEAFDAGDKATSKALSVAAKMAIWQVFTVPVRENPADRDPDFVAHERTAPARPMRPANASRKPEPPPQAKTLADEPTLRAAFHACGVAVYGENGWDEKRPEIVGALGYKSSNEIPVETAKAVMKKMQTKKTESEAK